MGQVGLHLKMIYYFLVLLDHFQASAKTSHNNKSNKQMCF